MPPYLHIHHYTHPACLPACYTPLYTPSMPPCVHTRVYTPSMPPCVHTRVIHHPACLPVYHTWLYTTQHASLCTLRYTTVGEAYREVYHGREAYREVYPGQRPSWVWWEVGIPPVYMPPWWVSPRWYLPVYLPVYPVVITRYLKDGVLAFTLLTPASTVLAFSRSWVSLLLLRNKPPSWEKQA